MAGGPHHTVLSTAVGVEVLEDFAEMTGVELLVIDADTTPRPSSSELRWNAAYHRLAAAARLTPPPSWSSAARAPRPSGAAESSHLVRCARPPLRRRQV